MKIQWQQPIPISEVHRDMIAERVRNTGCDERTAWVDTTRDARLATPIIRHGSGKVVTDDPWAKYALPRKRKSKE